MSGPNYDPKTHRLMTFHDAVAKFRDGADTPRAYLERCLEKIDAIEDDELDYMFRTEEEKEVVRLLRDHEEHALGA